MSRIDELMNAWTWARENEYITPDVWKRHKANLEQACNAGQQIVRAIHVDTQDTLLQTGANDFFNTSLYKLGLGLQEKFNFDFVVVSRDRSLADMAIRFAHATGYTETVPRARSKHEIQEELPETHRFEMLVDDEAPQLAGQLQGGIYVSMMPPRGISAGPS